MVEECTCSQPSCFHINPSNHMTQLRQYIDMLALESLLAPADLRPFCALNYLGLLRMVGHLDDWRCQGTEVFLRGKKFCRWDVELSRITGTVVGQSSTYCRPKVQTPSPHAFNVFLYTHAMKASHFANSSEVGFLPVAPKTNQQIWIVLQWISNFLR